MRSDGRLRDRAPATRGLAVAALTACAVAAHAEETPPAGVPASDPPAAPGPEGVPARTPFRGTAEELAARHSRVTLSEIGRSRGGRAIRAATVAASEDAEVTWVALVVRGLAGGRPADEAALVLDVAAALAERTDLPRGVAFRFVLDGSPDASAADGAPTAGVPAPTSRGNATPTDDDADGATDEDGPDDADGDGRVGWMRVPDPSGDFAADDPAQPQSPVRADAAAGRAPAWRVLPEGRDDDGDGRWNEDGPGGAVVARNFPVAFEEHVRAAGRWAASEPETRALLDHVLADERIAVVYEIGDAETIAASPEHGAAWPKLPDDDAKLLEALRTVHGKAPDGVVRKAHPPGAGSLGLTAWHQLGRLWFGRAPLGRAGPPWPAPGAHWPHDLRLVWTPLTSPGAPAGAEIASAPPGSPGGGAAATDALAETDAVAEFLARLARDRARVAFTRTEVAGSSGVLRVAARLVNTGRLPTHTQRGADVRGRRPLNVRPVLPAGAKLLAGRPLVQVERLAGGAESEELRWVVAGPSGATVTLECVGPDTGRTVFDVVIP